MDIKKASKHLSDFITIGNNIFRKSKINFVGIEQIKDSENTLIFIRVEKSVGKSVNVPFDTLDKAEQELKRIEEELDKASFDREIADVELSQMPKEYIERISKAKGNEEILIILQDYENYKIYKNSMDLKQQ